MVLFFFSSRRRHTRWTGDWSSDVCSSDLRRWRGRRVSRASGSKPRSSEFSSGTGRSPRNFSVSVIRSIAVFGNGINLSMLSTARHENSPCLCAMKKISGKQGGNANAERPDRHEKPRAELTGAAGSHTSSTRRVRHYWLADIDPPPAFLRHNHAVSWTAGDDTGRLLDPRAHSRGHGGAIDFGSHRTCFPAFYYDATLAD